MSSIVRPVGIATWRIKPAGLASLAVAASAGVTSIEIDFGGPWRGPDLGEEAIREALHQRVRLCGLTIEALAVNRLNDIGMTAPAETERGAIVRSILVRAVKAARHLEITRLIVPGFRRSTIENERDFATTASNLSFVANIAASEGVRVSYEPNLDTDATLALVRAAGQSNLTIVFDTGNPALANRDAARMWPTLRSVSAPYVHVKDIPADGAGDVALGDGRADLNATFQAFARYGWPQGFVLEGDYRANAVCRIERDLVWLGRMIENVVGAR